MKNYQFLNVLFCSIFLTACGGGGGSDSSTPTPVVADFDNDGVADSIDSDDDNDGVPDTDDAFPFDPDESVDTDSDGIGNNADEDDDNDGVLDTEDAFPLDATESVDTDGDGIGNNTDQDDDNDGVPDIEDAFPLDPTETVDTDGDGIGNNADEDDDNDGVPDIEDAFPLDPNESADSDNDGVGDNADYYPNDANCVAQHDGNGEQCYLTYFKENIDNIKTYTFGQYVTFYDDITKQIIQLSSETGSFQPPIQLDITGEITSLAFAVNEQVFYAGSVQGVTYKVNTDGSAEILYESGTDVKRIFMLGAFIGIYTDFQYLTIVDKNGILVDQHYAYQREIALKWDEQTNTAFLYEGDTNYNPQLTSLLLDPENGQIQSTNHTYMSQNTSQDLMLPPQASDYLFYAGKVFKKSNLAEIDTAEIDPYLYTWDENTGLVTLNYAAGDTRLTWFNNDFTEYSNQTIEGAPVAVAQTQSRVAIITERISELNLSIFEFADDIDGDSVSNEVDAFPADIAASLDSDGDGYPDSWNEGQTEEDSTTGLTLDAFPQEFDCWFTEHAKPDGSCNYAMTIPAIMPTNTMTGPDDKAFLYLAETGRVYVYDASLQEFAASLNFEEKQQFGLQQTPQQITYSVVHERFYFHYGADSMFAKDYIDNDVSERFEVNSFSSYSPIELLMPVGNFMLVKMFGSTGSRYLIDANGVETDSRSGYYFSNTLAWNNTSNRLYHFSDGISPNDIFYSTIDQTTGQFGTLQESPYHGDYSFYGPIRITNGGQDVVTGAGDIFDAENLTWQGSYGPIRDILDLENDEVLIVNYANSISQIERKDQSNRVLERRQLDTETIDVIKTQNENILVYVSENQLVAESFFINNDTDGDGVDNLDDAFPIDIAASVDSDNDGYPDEWNAGYSETDSTTGLSLDAFPLDSACWLDSHATAEGSCDYSATMPSFTPNISISDDDGVVYLFNPADSTVYRWSSSTQDFINPIRVGQNNGFVQNVPSKMAYSSEHQRLYFGYSDGEITFVDLLTDLVEQPFYRLSQSVSGLASVGNYVLAVDASGAWNTHYVIDENGVLTDNQDWNHSSAHFAWNPSNERVYYFSNWSPRDLHYETIDQTSGLITSSGESPYHGDNRIVGPIVVSADGNRVILGSGDIYDADDLSWLGNIGEFDDAITLDNGEILMIQLIDNEIQVIRKDADNRTLEAYTLDASFARIVTDGSNHTFITIEDGNLNLWPYTANDDTDGDGAENTIDAFPLDPAASIDTDGDGYPDSWNDGYTSEDSTTGLILDVFPQDSACWQSDHATDTGSCDYSATMPIFTPSKTSIDENGVVYLFNAGDSKVYRWNPEDESYINPLQVGQTNGTSVSSPVQMTYSPIHRRLYFGYEDGAITYVELDGDVSEQAFYKLPLSVGGLAATGNYVLAQDASGARNTHYIIDQDGVLTDRRDWNRYSREYAWNDLNNRVYFFRDGTSPNDIHYEVIDQTSGVITEEGETPYHSSSNIRLPIRIINNGQDVILGSGVVYDANELTITEELETDLIDVAGFDEVFIAIVENNDTQILNVYRNDDYSLQHSEVLEHDTIAIYRWNELLVLVGQENGEFTYSFFNTGDNDGDLLPAWWELAYDLSDDDATDASLDNDNDGLTNLDEYLLNANPTLEDTDNDGLNDGEEVNIYETDLLNQDTDSDGLQDGEEVITHGTSPINADTDSDSFTDGDEVLLYNTDPLDHSSVPEAITSFSESFEESSISNLFGTTDSSDENWLVSTYEPQDGAQVARSGEISDSQTSSLTLRGLFASGTLTFDAKVSSESCCDVLRVYVNGELAVTVRDGDWSTQSVEISQGDTTIEWTYRKDGSVSRGEDSAFIDNIVFGQ